MSHRPVLEPVQRSERSEHGVVLLAFLLALALLAIGLMMTVDVWAMSRQRERERELLFVGEQYRLAIRSYYLSAPAAAGRSLPPSLAVLLDDDRFLIPKHHLRRAYPDPITGSSEWGLVRVNDGIIGVYSRSARQPIKQAGFPPAYQFFNEAHAYQDWIFTYQLPRGTRAATPAAPAASAPRAATPSPGFPGQRRSP